MHMSKVTSFMSPSLQDGVKMHEKKELNMEATRQMR